jgi:hypothetical protein
MAWGLLAERNGETAAREFGEQDFPGEIGQFVSFVRNFF